MKGIKQYFGNGIFSQIIQIILVMLFMSAGIHVMITYFKKNLPLPNIKVIEDRVRLRKQV
jgi:hypothetical protein